MAKKKVDKSKEAERQILLAFDSLQSHLPYIHSGKNKRFHRKCILEYLEIIISATKLWS